MYDRHKLKMTQCHEVPGHMWHQLDNITDTTNTPVYHLMLLAAPGYPWKDEDLEFSSQTSLCVRPVEKDFKSYIK